MAHTLYSRLAWIAADGTRHEPGEQVEFPEGDTEHLGLLRHGVLDSRPPRRQPGENSGRLEKTE